MSALTITVNGQVSTVQLGTLSAAVNQQITQAVSASAASAAAAATTAAAISAQQLITWAYTSAFQLVSATRDANEAIVTASIVWPDGTAGTFTTDTASAAFPGAIDAWHATYAGTPAKTVMQSAVTRDASGAVTAQPAITIV